MAERDASGPLIVKKYGNRRLYDTDASRYITLDELAELLQGGRDVKVIDAKSGADLTKSVLLQIISEQEKDRDMLPVAFLKQVVQLGDASMRDALQRYLGFGLDAFMDAQKEMEQRYRDLAGSFLNPFSMLAGQGARSAARPDTRPTAGEPANQAPLHAVPEPEPVAEEPAPEPAPAPPPDAQAPPPEGAPDATAGVAATDRATKAELEQLKAQMAAMQELLAKLGGGK